MPQTPKHHLPKAITKEGQSIMKVEDPSEMDIIIP